MTKLSDYIQGEMDILFFAPEKNDVVRAVNEMVGVETEETAAVDASGDTSSPFTILCSTETVVEDSSAAPSLVPATPDRSQSTSSTQASPSKPSAPTTPSKWNMKDLNFASAGFTPDEAIAINRKIESQKLIAVLTAEVKRGLTTPSKNTPLSAKNQSTPNSTATNNAPSFLLGGQTLDLEATIKRRMKLQSLVNALSKEQQDDMIVEGK